MLVGGVSCRLPAQQGWHAIIDQFLPVANPDYVVYNIYGKTTGVLSGISGLLLDLVNVLTDQSNY